MGDYLKGAYDLRDAVGIDKIHTWQVFYCGKVLKEFEKYDDMIKFFREYRKALSDKEKLDLTFDIHWLNAEPVGGLDNGIR